MDGIDEAIKDVNAAASRCSGSSFETTELVLNRLGSRVEICELIRQIANSDLHLAKAARRSFFHPNGFDRIILFSSDKPNYTVRLHIWWPVPQTNLEDIHNHAWDFSSHVLTGSYEFETFSLQERGDKFWHYKCGPPIGGGYGHSFHANGIVNASCEFSGIFQAGTTYSLSYEPLHRVRSDRSTMTSTIIVHGPFRQHSTDVLSINEMLVNKDVGTVRLYSPEELSSKLKRYLSTFA